MAKLLIIRGHSRLRNTSAEEIFLNLVDADRSLDRELIDLDTTGFADQIESGHWGALTMRVQEVARSVLEKANELHAAKIAYFGVDEVPTLIALGAFISDERRVECAPYNRDLSKFAWSTHQETVQFVASGIPGESVDVTGNVIVKIELSYPIRNEDINSVVSTVGRLAEISIRPKHINPDVGIIKSKADLENFRMIFREVLAAINLNRPNAQLIHLFLAGPVNVCIAAGQELRLRNGRSVQTYRYRATQSPPMREAILLTPGNSFVVSDTLTEEEEETAQSSRNIWNDSLAEIIKHSIALRDNSAGVENEWPKYLLPQMRCNIQRMPNLAQIWTLVKPGDRVGEKNPAEFMFEPKSRTWHFNSRMMLLMTQAANDEPEKIRRFARAFFWHEYIHEAQHLTRNTSNDVGGLSNCLERVDYIADLYGVLHQTDFLLRGKESIESNDIKGALVRCIEDALAAFWTFEPRPPTLRWQQRRLRRYLNWYWRLEQISRCDGLKDVMDLLCEPPIIELAGLPISTDGRRVFLELGKVEQSNRLEIGIISSRSALFRVPSSTTLSIDEMVKAFINHDSQGLIEFFEALFDHAKPSGSAF